jgi:hypothetical protein
MSETAAGGAPRRVLVTLRAEGDAAELLETATRLAAGLQAELVGLFAPDDELEIALGRPGTRLIGSSGVERSVDAGYLRCARRVLAAEARTLLASTAERHGTRWSFRAAETYSTTAILAELGPEDVLAFHRRRRHPHRPVAGSRPVVVFHAGSAGALVLGDQLAAITGRPLAVVVAAEDAESLGRLEAEALAWLEAQGRERRVERLEPATVAGMAERLRLREPAMAVVDRRLLAAEWDALEDAATEVACTLFALR